MRPRYGLNIIPQYLLRICYAFAANIYAVFILLFAIIPAAYLLRICRQYLPRIYIIARCSPAVPSDQYLRRTYIVICYNAYCVFATHLLPTLTGTQPLIPTLYLYYYLL